MAESEKSAAITGLWEAGYVAADVTVWNRFHSLSWDERTAREVTAAAMPWDQIPDAIASLLASDPQ